MPAKDFSFIKPVQITPFYTQPVENNTDEQRMQSSSVAPVNTGAVLQNDRQFTVPKVGEAQKRVSLSDWVAANQPKVDLSKDIRRAERERKQHLFGNVATVLGQGLGSLMGARQFTQVQNNDPYYLQRIDQLRNQQRAYDADWAKNRFNILYDERKADVAQQRANDAAKAQFGYNAALKQIDAANDAAKRAEDRAFKIKEYEFEGGENEKNRNNQLEIAKIRERGANYRATLKNNEEGTGSRKDRVAFTSDYGDIILRNDDIEAITLRALSMMKDDPVTEPSDKMNAIALMNSLKDGNDPNSLFDAKKFVNDRLKEGDKYKHVWNEMVNYAKRYGSYTPYETQKKPLYTEDNNTEGRKKINL